MGSHSRRNSVSDALSSLLTTIPNTCTEHSVNLAHMSSVPPFELFASKIPASSALDKFEKDVRIDDVLIVKVKKFDVVGAFVKPMCFAVRLKRDLEWLEIQYITPLSALSRRLTVGEYMEAKITDINPIKLILTEALPMASSQLPEYFREGRDLPHRFTFWDFMIDRQDFENPYLEKVLGFPSRSQFSLLQMDGLEQDRCELASHLRRRQDAELAMEHVVKGVTEMKSGNRTTAIQQFNQALVIDSLCVDALVARGAALYQACMCRCSNRKLVDSITLCVPPRLSNDGHFTEAEADFDQALSIQRDHQNARNYMVETLISYAGLLEVQGEIEQARAKYEKVLRIKEERRAKAGLEKLDKRKRSPPAEIVDSRKRRKSLEEMKKEEAEKRKRRRQQEEEKEKRKHDKKKLQEMEAFIKALKNGK